MSLEEMTAKDKKSDEPKLCLFCGVEAYFESIDSCGCIRCGLENFTIEEWNTRPLEDALRAELINARQLLDGAMGEIKGKNAAIAAMTAERDELKRAIESWKRDEEGWLEEHTAMTARAEKAEAVINKSIDLLEEMSNWDSNTPIYELLVEWREAQK